MTIIPGITFNHRQASGVPVAGVGRLWQKALQHQTVGMLFLGKRLGISGDHFLKTTNDVKTLRNRYEKPLSPVLDAYNPFAQGTAAVLFGAARRDGVKVGETTIVRRASGKAVRAVVTLEKEYASGSDSQEEDYRRYNLYVRGNKVGYTEIEPEDDDHIWVKYMEATENDKYKGIGTRLHQIAVEESFNRGFKGRVALYSLSEAVVFHYKSGFRSLKKHENRLIAKTIRQAAAEGIQQPSFDRSLDMMLPESKIRQWKTRIKQSPILARRSK